MPRPSAGHATAVLDGRLWLVGGTNWRGGEKYWLDDILAYDIEAKSWSAAGSLPLPISYAAKATDGEALYICGGSDGESPRQSCTKLTVVGDRLKLAPLPPLPEARVYAGAAIDAGVLYVVAGAPSHSDLSRVADTLFALDLGSPGDGWTSLSPLPRGCFIPAVAAAGGKIYAFGGGILDAEGHAVNLADSWVYDPGTDAWETALDLPSASRGSDAIAVSDELILLVGGYSATFAESEANGPAYGFSDVVLAYQPGGDSMEEVGHIPVPCIGTAPVSDGEFVYITGGEERMRSRIDVLATAPIAPQ